jgi:hypothetical protein
MAEAVQLGLLRLELDSGPSTPEASWSILTTDRLKHYEVSEKDKTLRQALLDLLGDVGIGFSGECRIDENGCLIRMRLTPCDVSGSTWTRTARTATKRKESLKTIFGRVKQGWDAEEGRYLMDCLVCFLIGLELLLRSDLKASR